MCSSQVEQLVELLVGQLLSVEEAVDLLLDAVQPTVRRPRVHTRQREAHQDSEHGEEANRRARGGHAAPVVDLLNPEPGARRSSPLARDRTLT